MSWPHSATRIRASPSRVATTGSAGPPHVVSPATVPSGRTIRNRLSGVTSRVRRDPAGTASMTWPLWSDSVNPPWAAISLTLPTEGSSPTRISGRAGCFGPTSTFE
jgi:hypothetical protein